MLGGQPCAPSASDVNCTMWPVQQLRCTFLLCVLLGHAPQELFKASLPVQAYEMVSEQRGVSRHSNGSSDEAARMECAIYAALGAQLPGMLPVRSSPNAAMAAQLWEVVRTGRSSCTPWVVTGQCPPAGIRWGLPPTALS